MRPDKHDFETLTSDTWSVHGGNHADETTGAIRTPIVMANSYRLPADPTTIDDPQAHIPLSDWRNWTSWNAP